MQPDWHLDGVNLLPYLTGKNDAAPHDVLFWRLGPQWAVRKGDWKLVEPRDHSQKPSAPGLANLAVFPTPWQINLATDIGEEHDLAAENPDKVQELKAAWDEWNSQLEEPGWLN